MSKIDKAMQIDLDFKPDAGNVKIDSYGRKLYYYKDESSGNYVTVEEYSEPKKLPGYTQVIHRAEAGYKFSEIISSGKNTGINCGYFGSDSVSIYYWSGDIEHRRPLAIQVGYWNSYYVYEKTSTEWKNWNKGNNALLKKLDDLNCSLNSAHIVDITKKGNNYSCSSCKAPIYIEIDDLMNTNSEYRVYEHRAASYCYVGRLKEESINLTGFETSHLITCIYVYYYKTRVPLIRIQSLLGDEAYQLYKRERKYGFNWVKIPNELDNYDSTGTLSFIKEINEENYSIFHIIKVPIACAVLGTFSLFSTCEAYCIIFSQDKSLILRGIRFLASLRS